MADLTIQDWRVKMIQDWLLAVLRFAVTRNQVDQSAVMMTARMMDGAGRSSSSAGFAFFSRISCELCAAIADEGRPNRVETLRRHIARIDNPRLRLAFKTVIDLPTVKPAGKNDGRARLWDGLPNSSRI
jgi:hypothetical protein